MAGPGQEHVTVPPVHMGVTTRATHVDSPSCQVNCFLFFHLGTFLICPHSLHTKFGDLHNFNRKKKKRVKGYHCHHAFRFEQINFLQIFKLQL